jgi:hypothetical protein
MRRKGGKRYEEIRLFLLLCGEIAELGSSADAIHVFQHGQGCSGDDYITVIKDKREVGTCYFNNLLGFLVKRDGEECREEEPKKVVVGSGPFGVIVETSFARWLEHSRRLVFLRV